MPIDSPSSTSDSTAERGRCQRRRARHENRRDLVQPPKAFIGFPSDGTELFPLKLILSSYNPLFQRQRLWRAVNFNERVGGATPCAARHTFRGRRRHCRPQVDFIGGYWIGIKGIDAQENRAEQMPSPHERCPGCKCVECRLKKGWYFTRSRQHRTDHGDGIGGSVWTHGGDRGRRQRRVRPDR